MVHPTTLSAVATCGLHHTSGPSLVACQEGQLSKRTTVVPQQGLLQDDCTTLCTSRTLVHSRVLPFSKNALVCPDMWNSVIALLLLLVTCCACLTRLFPAGSRAEASASASASSHGGSARANAKASATTNGGKAWAKAKVNARARGGKARARAEASASASSGSNRKLL